MTTVGTTSGSTITEPSRDPRPRGTVLLEAADVSKRFMSGRGAVTALAHCNVVVHQGEFVCLVGPSGCGKSTLLRLLGGLDRPSSGSVQLKGRRINGPDDELAFVFQRSVLLPWLSVLRNALLPVALRGRPTAEQRQRAIELLELVGVDGFERHLPRELSGGMQQRVSLARALITDPLVLLMDEPFAALDALTRERMAVELQHIVAADAKTTVFVTHSIPESALLGDRVVVLSARPGAVVEDIPIDLPRPRGLDVTETPTYLEAVARIRAALERGATAGHRGPDSEA